MADETPAVAPAAAPVAVPVVQASATIPGFRFGSAHLAGLAGAGYAGNELVQPLVHWAVTGGIPDAKAESSLATIVSLLAAGIVIFFTRGRAGVAAALNGDQTNE
jgi:uncharacterized membrane protein required for colicin V production